MLLGAVARARLPARCRLQAAGGQLGGARDEEAAHPFRQPPGAGARTCWRTSSSGAAWCARSPWSPTRSRPRASTSTGRASSNRDTAFYMGARGDRARHALPGVLHRACAAPRAASTRCISSPSRDGRQALPPGALTERYARLVEEQIRAAPPDWPWSHKRWKLKRSRLPEPRPLKREMPARSSLSGPSRGTVASALVRGRVDLPADGAGRLRRSGEVHVPAAGSEVGDVRGADHGELV